jgi:hypothetical protein
MGILNDRYTEEVWHHCYRDSPDPPA